MPEFTVDYEGDDGYGRLGTLDVPKGPVNTPALFPVINLIGGTTLQSGSAWRHFRDDTLEEEHLQGTMFQAMSFLEYGVTADSLEWWREKPLEDRLARNVDVTSPIFIDSGGFRLMNSEQFGHHPTEGGTENDWHLYTNPDSVLKLQADFGGHILATLDYPILQDLAEEEKTERMEKSIESAVRCLRLLQNPDKVAVTLDEVIQEAEIEEDSEAEKIVLQRVDDGLRIIRPVSDDTDDTNQTPLNEQLSLHDLGSGEVRIALRDESSESVTIDKRDFRSVRRIWEWKEQQKEPGIFVAIHGHDYETINWYVASFLERAREEGVEHLFHGFAIGSLVPLRSETDTLIDVVQGAKDAIPESRRDEIALHVFGVGGKQASLLALLGVDSFDCSSHMQAASFKKYVIPGSWEHVVFDDIDDYLVDGDYPCDLDYCPLCKDGGHIKPWVFKYLINRTPTYGADGITKGWLYALLARHNFEVYNHEVRRVREAIAEDRLLDYVIDFAREHEDIKRGLKHAQVRDAELQSELERRGAHDLVVGLDIATDQARLADFDIGLNTSKASRTISLKHTPNSFNIFERNHTPNSDKEILLFIPCSKEKPYSQSRTHRAVFDRLQPIRDNIQKITISGLYGPVPEENETDKPVLEYNYVLAQQDEEQIEIVTDRVTQYIEQYEGEFDTVVGYAASKTYRNVLEDAFETTGTGELFPRNPDARLLREHFRKENINELLAYLGLEDGA